MGNKITRARNWRKELIALTAGALLAAGVGTASAQTATDYNPGGVAITPSVYQPSCPSNYYKVVWRGWYETTDSWICVNGPGIHYPSSTITNSLESIIKVCPGKNYGRIQYKMANGNTYNSTWRGPHTNNSTCYSFTGDLPVRLIQIEIQ